MFEEIKEILVMLAQAGGVTLTAALSIVVAFGIYKLLTLASILVLVKFIVEKIYNYAIAKKVDPKEKIKWEIRNTKFYVSDEVKMYKIAQLSYDLYFLRKGIKPEEGMEENTFGWRGMETCLKILQEETQKCLSKKDINENV